MQAILLAGALPMFVGALLNDIAYANTFQLQWKNFASWLLVGGLALALIVLVWAIADFIRLTHDRGARRVVYVAVLLTLWVSGFVNALVHAGDAWASMPEGLILSAVTSLLSMVAVWLGFSNYHDRARVPA